MTKAKYVSISFVRSSDSRKPIIARLMVQSSDWDIETLADLDEHQFAALMSGQCIAVGAEI